MSYFDGDGLLRKYGTEKATANIAGEYRYDGPVHCIEAKITLSALAATPTIVSDVLSFPKGAIVEEIEITTRTAATGATATLNLGLIRNDRTTEIDYDGFLAAFPLASMDAAGEKTSVKVGSTGAGALFGNATANTGYLTADYDTAAFTAGVIFVRIYYFMP